MWVKTWRNNLTRVNKLFKILHMKYLKLHTLTKGQWYDRDTLLLYAAFQVLVDFIEQERPDEIVNWEHDELHRNAWNELSQLYRWWKEERPQRRDPMDDVASPPQEEYRFLEGGQMTFPDRRSIQSTMRRWTSPIRSKTNGTRKTNGSCTA